MNPRSLTRVAVGITLVVLAVLFAILFLDADSEATQHCVDSGYTEEECGWR